MDMALSLSYHVPEIGTQTTGLSTTFSVYILKKKTVDILAFKAPECRSFVGGVKFQIYNFTARLVILWRFRVDDAIKIPAVLISKQAYIYIINFFDTSPQKVCAFGI